MSIIVPTLNEEETIPLLLTELSRTYPGATVIVADDDSKDRTRAVADAFEGPLRIRVLHRTPPSVCGLTASVVDALRIVDTPHFIVMDADLQHPPEAVRAVYEHASNGADLAVGRRTNYAPMTPARSTMSRTARALTRSYLRVRGKPLVDDPMSGFFGGKTVFAHRILDASEDRFEKAGFKVLVDFLGHAPRGTKVEEVPYQFGRRAAGASKLGLKQTASLLRQLGPLGRVGATALLAALSPEFWKFALVGLSGVLVNQGVLFAAHGVGQLPLLVAGALAIELAILWNFLWNDRWSFRKRVRHSTWTRRLARFNVHCLGGAVLNGVLLAALATGAGLHYLVANLVGIAASMIWNFAWSSRWTWHERDPLESVE